LNAVVGEDCAI